MSHSLPLHPLPQDQPLLLVLTFFTGLLSLRLGLELGGVGQGEGMWVGRRESSA